MPSKNEKFSLSCNMINFSKTLRGLRKENNMTQKQLAEKLGVSDTSIRDWENRGIQPNYQTLYELSKIFNVSIGQLLGTEEV